MSKTFRFRKYTGFNRRFERKKFENYFKPSTRGNILKSINNDTLYFEIPESPRPLEMLLAKVAGEDNLTCNDMILHELLISLAYENDQSMSADTYSVELSTIVKFIGLSVRKSTIQKSLERLTNTKMNYGRKAFYRNVPMLAAFKIEDKILKYKLPDAICVLMFCMKKYTYIEMIALREMKSKYLLRLYKVFIKETSNKKWKIKDSLNSLSLSYSVPKFLKLISYESDYRKFKSKVLTGGKQPYNLYMNTNKFSFEISEKTGSGRGRAIEEITFSIHLNPTSHQYLYIHKADNRLIKYGGADLPVYRVNSHIWRKAQKLMNAQRALLDGSHPKNIFSDRCFFKLWLIALHEAISGIEAADMMHYRRFRGPSLLSEIKKYGADEAAWGLICEELSDPDISLHKDRFEVLANNAEVHRIERMKAAGIIKKERYMPEKKLIQLDEYLPAEELKEKQKEKLIQRINKEKEYLKTYNDRLLSLKKHCDDFENKKKNRHKNLVIFVGKTSKEILENQVAPTIKNMGFSGEEDIRVCLYSDVIGYWYLGKYKLGAGDLFRIIKYVGNYLEFDFANNLKTKPFQWRDDYEI